MLYWPAGRVVTGGRLQSSLRYMVCPSHWVRQWSPADGADLEPLAGGAEATMLINLAMVWWRNGSVVGGERGRGGVERWTPGSYRVARGRGC